MTVFNAGKIASFLILTVDTKRFIRFEDANSLESFKRERSKVFQKKIDYHVINWLFT